MAKGVPRARGGATTGAPTGGAGGGVDEPPQLAAKPTSLHTLDQLSGGSEAITDGTINVPLTKAASRVMGWCVIEDALRNAVSYGMSVKERVELAFRTVQLLDGQKHVWTDDSDKKANMDAEEMQKVALEKEARLRELLRTKDKLTRADAAIKLAESDVDGGVQ